MNIKAVIFDMDGTLTDTERFQFEGWVKILKDIGLDMTMEEYLDYLGRAGEWIEKELIRKHGLKFKEGYLIEKKKVLILKWLEERPIELMPGIRDLIDDLAEKGIMIAVATGSNKEEVEIKLERSGLSGSISALVTKNDVGKSKPSPDVYLKVMEKLGLEPDACVAVEDSRPGMLSAKAAGLRCLVIPNELTEKQDFSEADGVFRTFKEAFDSLE